MITLDEYARIVKGALEELSGIITRDAEKVLKTALPIRMEVDEAVGIFRNAQTTRGQILTTSFGLIDEYVRFRWAAVVDELYQEYTRTEGRQFEAEE